jgi:deoxycytidine triphosphate deaminase
MDNNLSESTWTANLDYTGVVVKEDIIELSHEQNLIIPHPEAESGQYQSSSFDLSVGTIVVPGQGKTDQHPMNPGDIATMLTNEELNMPVDLSARVFPINNLSRKGLLVLNPGHIDPGYKGVISVKLINLTENTEVIHHGMEIFTCIFESLGKEASSYSRPYYPPDERATRIRRDAERSAPSALVEVQGEGFEQIAQDVYDSNEGSEWVRLAVAALLAALLGYFFNDLLMIAQQASSGGS